MFKVIIIDDEDFIREGLKTIIDWEEHGFTVCGEAVDGLDAIEKIRLLKPDLALVDVKMPRMDGLELIKQINQEGVNCRSIIISGYSEFEYAKKALNYGAKAYILKPVNEEELAEKVKSVYCETLEGIRKDEYIRTNSETAANKIMEKLLSGNINYREIEEYNQMYGFNLPWKTHQLLLVNVDSLGISERVKLEGTLRDWVARGWQGIAFSLGDYMGVMIKDLEFRNTMSAVLDNLYDMITDCIGKKILIAVGKPQADMDSLFSTFMSLRKVVDNSFLYGSARYVFCQQHESIDRNMEEISTEEVVEKLFAAIETDNRKAITQVFDRLSRSFINLQFSEKRIKMEYVKLCMSLNNKFSSHNIKQELLSDESIIGKINDMLTLKELNNFIKDRLFLLAETLASQRPEGVTRKIIDYIERNYADNAISLKKLASLYGYNPTYLGALFKSHTGMSFNEYLEMLRINNAKRLLKEGVKANQVADMVGYSDYDYFYKKFKKRTGMSPSSFKGS